MKTGQEPPDGNSQQTDPPAVRSRRRRWIPRIGGALVLLTFVLIIIETFVIEPTWLKVKHLKLASNPTLRIVHVTDFHYKGEKEYVERVVRVINEQKPDIVAVTGDLVEDEEHVTELLEILKGVKAPMLGVPGNHETGAFVEEQQLRDMFAANGGRWLNDESFIFKGVLFQGIGDKGGLKDISNEQHRILLCHYPAVANWVKSDWDLMLAGHTHGGQIRLPFIGSLITPYNSSGYDMGLYKTEHGPLYVNPGIGWFHIRARFLCRPEVTVIDL